MRAASVTCLTLCLILALLPAPAAAEQGTFTLEEVLCAPYPYLLTSARGADRLAWAFQTEGRRNVWTAAGPEFVPVNLTGTGGDEIFQIRAVEISNDGEVVVFVRGGDPNQEGWVINPDSHPSGREQAVWAVRTDGGRPWRLGRGSRPKISPDGRRVLFLRDGGIFRASLQHPGSSGFVPKAEPLFAAQGSNHSPQWSPDGKRVAFVSSRGDHSFIGVYDTGAHRITWMTPGVDQDSEPVWSRDGRMLAFLRRPGRQYGSSEPSRDSTDTSLWIANARTGKGREVWRPDPRADKQFFSLRSLLFAAGDRLLFSAEQNNWNHVFALSLKGGPPVDLTPGDGFVEHQWLSPDGRTLFISSNRADIHGRHIWKVSTERGGPEQLTSGATLGTYPAALASGSGAAFLFSTAVHPLSVAVVDARSGETRVIGPPHPPAAFPMDELVTPELVIATAPDGLEIPCQLFLPRDAKPGDKRPGIVYTHGGPIRQMLLGWHYMDFYSDAYGINQYFANRGYVVISINYRSGIGYGRSFRRFPETGRRGAGEYQDLVAGARLLQERPEVDPERVGLWGLSYGGYLTAMGLARNSDIFKAGVDMAGVHDWSNIWGRRDGMTAEEAKIAIASSPIADVETWSSPVLFIHGDDDRNVPFSQTVDLVQKLRAKGGVTVELMICPDEPHEFLLQKNRIGAYRATFDFLDRYLGKAARR